ncbi:2-hydroxyacylsphingosine 1-beta-galactosyltransferase-like [Asterias amurensis]|uniref:2-hydroxyacylsphingosine 1-beta-galactosyltransferase-like n=1 Tax=Asterias amurensis TaxID=7602 RepID=UPI003AB5590F
MTLSQSAKVLVRLGHHVTFLSSNGAPKRQRADDADLFSHVVFKTRYTKTDEMNAANELSRTTLRGESRNGFFIFNSIYDSVVYGNPPIVDVFLGQCDDLLSDDLAIAKLRSEEFDMLVGDSGQICNPLLAQKLDIPFVLCSNLPIIPAEYRLYYGVPADPSYIPEYTTRYTNEMTFFQRVHNVLSYGVQDFLLRQYLEMYYPLKVKHNIKPEMSMLDSQRQAEIMFVNGNYPLETARPLNPNTVFINPVVGLPSNQVVNEDVADFLETAPAGFVICSFGSYFAVMERDTLQMFADGFALLPYRVLWQTNGDMSNIKLADNVKIVKWVPLAQIMNHTNAKAIVSHGGINSVVEATLAALPVVGIPLMVDQFPNIDKVVAYGFGIALEFNEVTPQTLSSAITTVVEKPRFRERALHASRILSDLTSFALPAETQAHWILHVTKFGGDHLRPPINDSYFSNLLDVYLFLVLILALILGFNVCLLYFCCVRRCTRNEQSGKHKKE